MSWMTELSNIYDLIVNNADPLDDEKPLPLYHTQNNAQVTVILDGKGNFLDAKLVDPKNRVERATCMPCTTVAHTSGIVPYPLCDKFDYVAGDYSQYLKGKKLEEKHRAYLEILSGWADSNFSNDKLKSIACYVKKGTLISDLINKAKLFQNSSPDELEKQLINFVRWEVECPGNTIPEVWKDGSLQSLWIKYYESTDKNQGLCYVTGEKTSILDNHPDKIRDSKDKAKIVAKNTKQDFAYLGRFHEASEACEISSDVSLKAHNALRYLISKQGTIVGDGLTIVSWNSSETKHLPIVASGLEVLHSIQPEQKIEYSTGKEFADSLTKSIHGYYKNCFATDRVMVMILNAATQGRMSVLLYRELRESDFIKSLEEWHERMSWYCSFWQQNDDGTTKGQPVYTISSPSPKQIAETAYGVAQNKENYPDMRLKPKLYEKVVREIIPCIIGDNNRGIPYEIEKRCCNAASKIFTIANLQKRKEIVCTACSVYKYNHKKEGYKIMLEEERQTRDYLYGRLWAVAETLETKVLRARAIRDGKKPWEIRETNAVKYLQRFSFRPDTTWKYVHGKLVPYFKDANNKYRNLISDIESQLDMCPTIRTSIDKPLSGEYLLGYYAQLHDLEKKDADVNSEQEEK